MKQQGVEGGWVTAEYGMLPRSCNQRIQREKEKTGGRTHEIQRLVGRALRGVVDVKKLPQCTIWLDCDVLQGDGGTRCASITGGYVALVLALDAMKKTGKLNCMPIKDSIAAISVGIYENEIALDLDYIEDSNCMVDMNVVMTGNGNFVEVQGTAEGKSFSRQTMNAMLDSAEKGIRELFAKQKELLGGICGK
jgi:ribonuclease PH